MTVKLSGTKVALILAAMQRDDQVVVLPEGRRKAAMRQAASQLLAAGLAREIRARGDAPVWRRDDTGRSAYALKLTAAGMKAITGMNGGETAIAQSNLKPEGKTEGDDAPNVPERKGGENVNVDVEAPSTGERTAPRSGSKINAVVQMLSRPEGATLDALATATGWLRHTTSAALTGLRKRGYNLERSKEDKSGPSVYRLIASSTTEA